MLLPPGVHPKYFSITLVLLTDKVHLSICMLDVVQSYADYGIFGFLNAFNIIYCIYITLKCSFDNIYSYCE